MTAELTWLLVFIGVYPVVSSGLWIAGALLFRILDEGGGGERPPSGWPGVTVLIPAYNEEPVIARAVAAVREVDYPDVEVIVLDDGSTDETVATAMEAAGDDPRVEVVPDPVNVGKAERLNAGFRRARHDLVLVTDADTHLHPLAIRYLVARIARSDRVAAVAGSSHVTNRTNVLAAMQVLEAAAIIGLIRRTQAVTGHVSVVAGVLGLFRRDAVLEVGGYAGEMATEDIDLSWRLLLAGWRTTFEPSALVGMEVPTTMRSLWAQRKRWARGQGQVLHVHLPELRRWRRRSLWPLVLEGLSSVAWLVLVVIVQLASVAILALAGAREPEVGAVLLLFSWGIALAFVAAVQMAFSLRLISRYDGLAVRAALLGPLYPLVYWMISAAAALRSELPALLHGPSESRVVWDVAREEAGER